MPMTKKAARIGAGNKCYPYRIKEAAGLLRRPSSVPYYSAAGSSRAPVANPPGL